GGAGRRGGGGAGPGARGGARGRHRRRTPARAVRRRGGAAAGRDRRRAAGGGRLPPAAAHRHRLAAGDRAVLRHPAPCPRRHPTRGHPDRRPRHRHRRPRGPHRRAGGRHPRARGRGGGAGHGYAGGWRPRRAPRGEVAVISFLRPWWLLALAAVAAVVAGYLWRQRRRRVHAVRFSNTDLLRRIAPAGLGWRRHLPAAALAACLLALVTAMARPTMERPEPVERATIMLAIDVSLSMEADDVTPTRLRAAQQAAIDFVNDLPPAHNLGVVSFAGTARVLVPPGTDRQAAVRAIESLQLSEETATGEAVFTCLEAIEAMPTY